MINPYHQVAVQSEHGWVANLGFPCRTPRSQSGTHTQMGRVSAPYSGTLWPGTQLLILKKGKSERVEALPVFMKQSWGSAATGPALLRARVRACTLTHLDELDPFVLHSADLGLWKQEAAIQREGHDIGGDPAIVLFRLESHDDLVIRVGDELEG